MTAKMKQTFLHIREIIGLKLVEIGITVLPDGVLQNHLVVGLQNGLVDTLEKDKEQTK